MGRQHGGKKKDLKAHVSQELHQTEIVDFFKSRVSHVCVEYKNALTLAVSF